MENNIELKIFIKNYVEKLFTTVSGTGSIGKKKMCQLAGTVLESDLSILLKKMELNSLTKQIEPEKTTTHEKLSINEKKQSTDSENEVKKKPRAARTTTSKKTDGSKRKLNWSNIRINKECGIRAFDTEYYNSVQLEITSGELEDVKNSPMSICKEIISRWKHEDSNEGNESRFQDWVLYARAYLGDDAPDSDPTSPSPTSKTSSKSSEKPKPKPKGKKPKAILLTNQEATDSETTVSSAKNKQKTADKPPANKLTANKPPANKQIQIEDTPPDDDSDIVCESDAD